MRIAIVDDDPDDRARLLSFLDTYFSENGEDYQTEVYEDAVSFLNEYAFTFDFVIFDIDMPRLSGIDAAKELRKKDPSVTLMFVTNMPQYALDGYSVEAVDYVLKPFSYPDFKLKMKKAARYIRRNADAAISLSTPDGIIKCNASGIFYVESMLHYLYYHTSKGVFKIRGKLSDVEKELLPYHFARSGKSYLVNLAHLESIEGSQIVVGEERLPLSRRMKPLLLSAFAKYMGGMDS